MHTRRLFEAGAVALVFCSAPAWAQSGEQDRPVATVEMRPIAAPATAALAPFHAQRSAVPQVVGAGSGDSLRPDLASDAHGQRSLLPSYSLTGTETLQTVANARAALRDAEFENERGDVIGAVTGVKLGQQGEPASVDIALFGTGRDERSARHVQFDAHDLRFSPTAHIVTPAGPLHPLNDDRKGL